MNNWTGIGNLGSDPVLYRTPSGKSVLNFSIAVDRFVVINTPEGPMTRKDPDWIPIVVFGDQAEHQAKYLQKGSKVGITGSLRQREWVTADGAKRTSIEVQALTIDWLDRIRSNDAASDAA